MSKISRQEGNRGCPYCSTQCKYFHRRMLVDDQTGRRTLRAGEFYSCECGSLTFSPGSGEYNLKMDIDLGPQPSRGPRVRRKKP